MRKRKVKDPIIGIVNAKYSDNCIKDALDLIHSDKILAANQVVVITANMVDNKSVDSGTVVHPDLLRKVIRYVKQFSPFRIVVAAGSGGAPTKRVFDEIGFSKIIHEEMVEFVDLNSGPYTEIQLSSRKVPSTKINRLFEEADVHISFTPIKMHKEATVSLGIKNVALSWPPAEIHGMPKTQLGIHEELHEFIYAMGEIFPIDITILTGMNGMYGTGPSDGKPVHSDLIIAGTDPVATDAVGARIMGFLPQAVQYLFRLYRRGIGEADVKRMDMRGVPLIEAEETYSMAALGHKIAIDRHSILSVHGQ
ncbi:MAG: (Fe-S)-binding protein [Clostridiales bacterium GWB2_37_7]|nr:MAG: (Fe-S)-binding protein [Clostridiales bacterium GWB2_37_7]